MRLTSWFIHFTSLTGSVMAETTTSQCLILAELNWLNQTHSELV